MGCLLEEVILFEGEPRLKTTHKCRLELLKLSVYHLDSNRLNAARAAAPGEHWHALNQLTVSSMHEKPVWSGELTLSGSRAGVANLRRWMVSRRDQQAAERALDPKLIGGVVFGSGGGERGNVVTAGGGGDVLATTGVIGNVIHIEAPDPTVYGKERFEPTSIFAIAGIVLVGRRVNDPLNAGLTDRAGSRARRKGSPEPNRERKGSPDDGAPDSPS